MTIDEALSLLSGLLGSTGGLIVLIQKAIADGRRDITTAELATLQLGDDSAKASLDAAIAAARAEGK